MGKGLFGSLDLLDRSLASKAHYWEITGSNQMGNAPKHFTVSTTPSSVKAHEQPGSGQNVVGEHSAASVICISPTCVAKSPLFHLQTTNIWMQTMCKTLAMCWGDNLSAHKGQTFSVCLQKESTPSTEWPFTSCVTLGKSVNISWVQHPLLLNGIIIPQTTKNIDNHYQLLTAPFEAGTRKHFVCIILMNPPKKTLRSRSHYIPQGMMRPMGLTEGK